VAFGWQAANKVVKIIKMAIVEKERVGFLIGMVPHIIGR
jgi:hypothetical protein